LPDVVRVTVAGMPDSPLVPLQTAQLTATAAYSDGAVSDVTDTATWETTDPGMLTVSTAGLVTATGPGKANVSASFSGKSGYVSAEVVVPPAAYFIDGVEYAFDYELDAQGRVTNYRVSQREGIVYPTPSSTGTALWECTGNLYGSYHCASGDRSMTGEAGRIVSVSGRYPDPWSATYAYGTHGLSAISTERQGPVNLESMTSATTLTYDSSGRLTEVRSESIYNSRGPGYLTERTAQIELDSLGRLLHADVVVVNSSSWGGGSSEDRSSTDWTYDAAGFMKAAGSTQYSADAEGWLVSRSTSQGDSITVDNYDIVRFGAQVLEEQFTQAEPSAYYQNYSRAPQRVRYEWGRLPAEPLFVPRALTGLQGADYFGIISSHHR